MSWISHDSKLNASGNKAPQLCAAIHNHQEVKIKYMVGWKSFPLVEGTGDRRSGLDRRQFFYDVHIPERRSGIDRRRGADRRSGKDRRRGAGRRKLVCVRIGPERRSGVDRRSGNKANSSLI